MPMAKRGNGEGSIYRRKDGDWVAAITLAKDGRRREFYGRTRADVKARLATAAGDHQRGILPTGQRQTVGAFLNRWIEDSVRGQVRPTTEAHYELCVRHLVRGLGNLDLERLTPADVEHYLRSKQDQLATRTINHHRAVLRVALNRAMKWGLVHRNAAALASAPRVVAKPSRFLTPAEAAAVLLAVKGDRLEALYSVALALGLRQGEALGLQWDDVDFDTGQLHVRRQLQRLKGESHLMPVKTEHSLRTLTMPLVVVAALHDHRRRQLEEGIVQSLVFCRQDGRPLVNSNVTHAFQERLRRAGLPPMRFHDLRHSCASLLLAQGVSARVVMETLGHSTIATTMNVYSHVMPSLMQESADAMDRALSVPSSPATTPATPPATPVPLRGLERR
jgi:integrase